MSEIVQPDETVLNYECKSHRGRSLENKTVAFWVFKTFEGILIEFSQIIEDKKIQNNIFYCIGASI